MQPFLFVRSLTKEKTGSVSGKQKSFTADDTEVALAHHPGSSATLGDGLAQVCQRSLSSYEDPSADGTGLAGHKVRALVRGEAASGASVPARSADNGPGIHMPKIAVGA